MLIIMNWFLVIDFEGEVEEDVVFVMFFFVLLQVLMEGVV